MYNRKYIKKEADETKMVMTGRLAVVFAMVVALMFTWTDVLGIGGAGGFTFIQKYTGYISPGVFAVFLLGMFWKRTTGAAAIAGILFGFAFSVFFNDMAPALLGNENWLYTAYPNGKGAYEIPFLLCMGYSFVFTVIIMILMSLTGPKINPKAFNLDREMFKIKPITIVQVVITLLILMALYVKFW